MAPHDWGGDFRQQSTPRQRDSRHDSARKRIKYVLKSGQAVWAVILNSTTLTTSVIAGTSTSSDTQVLATYLPANEWDYWTVTPGQFLCWRSTSTSTNAWISVTEIS